MHQTDFSYLTRKEAAKNPDRDYPIGGGIFYDVVYCGTCSQTDIEPEIQKCDDCGFDVCPHCCGTVYGWHEVCRQQVDGEIDPLIDREAFKRGQESFSPEIVALREQVSSLTARNARLNQCGLCGKPETPDNAIFICCQDCSHLGYSEVPKEVFELQRQRDAALASVAALTEERDRLKACVEHYGPGTVDAGEKPARIL